ncbi:MAG: gamma-glutamyltransferase [Acidimicrobiia bacterium]|nr:gamma-glutamyltransferase [Acidimicrobiia bacterium]
MCLLRPLLVLGLIFAFVAEARQPVRVRRAMVVAQEPLAADVGVEVLKKGGNAVDAAVAVAFALAVTLPSAGNLGGGGFLLARMAGGETTFLDFRERAPLGATREMYLDAEGKPTRDSVTGWRAAGVPGTVRGLEVAHSKYGRMSWRHLVAPAVKLAQDGFEVSYALAESLRRAQKDLEPFAESKRIFLKGGAFHEAGGRLAQPELARTLARIARHGAKDFYEGETAKILAEESKAGGGLITLEDLNRYEATVREPLKGSYKGFSILTAPPPSAGGIGLLQMMGVLEGSGYEKAGPGAAETIHFVAEAMRRYYADRSRHLGDPEFHRVPWKGLLNPRYIAAQRASINRNRASVSSEVEPGDVSGYESTETTHFSIVDAGGNAVALTYTINESYGNGVTVPRLGFLLNNEMDDFAAKPGSPNLFGLVQGEANAIAPGKRPVSSMTPAILLRGGKLYMVIGAPGGSRIVNGVMQAILNVVDFGMNLQDAVDAPRFHHQWMPDQISLEKGFSPDTVELLKSKGHKIAPIEGVARVEAILIEGGWLQGATDGRGSGKAAGY